MPLATERLGDCAEASLAAMRAQLPAIERLRSQGARPEVRVRAEAAGVRLHRRWTNLESRRGLRSSVVAVAVARELAGWCWSLAVMDD